MKRHLLTFDCYGTLIDWESGIAAAFEAEATRQGRIFDRTAALSAYAESEAEVESGDYAPYRDVLAESARRAARALGWREPAEGGAFLPESLASWHPFSDTNASLEKLAGRFALGILSNVDDDLLAATRQHFSVGWDLIVTAQQVRSYKPAHGHWVEARRLSGARHDRWTHVAQSHYHDVVPALELKLAVVWVNRHGQRLAPAQQPPTHEVRDLAEAADLLLSRPVEEAGS